MEEKHIPSAPILAAILLLVPALYVGSYFALVEQSISFSSGWATAPIPEEYRIGGSAAKWLFYPLNRLDRKVRRSYWVLEEVDDFRIDFSTHGSRSE